jgi:nucleoid DNA-binding protein
MDSKLRLFSGDPPMNKSYIIEALAKETGLSKTKATVVIERI